MPQSRFVVILIVIFAICGMIGGGVAQLVNRASNQKAQSDLVDIIQSNAPTITSSITTTVTITATETTTSQPTPTHAPVTVVTSRVTSSTSTTHKTTTTTKAAPRFFSGTIENVVAVHNPGGVVLKVSWDNPNDSSIMAWTVLLSPVSDRTKSTCGETPETPKKSTYTFNFDKKNNWCDDRPPAPGEVWRVRVQAFTFMRPYPHQDMGHPGYSDPFTW